jgi:hypothetical protein
MRFFFNAHYNYNQMKHSVFSLPTVLLSSMLLVTSCQKEAITTDETAVHALSATAATSNVFKGPVVQIGDGHARSWIRIGHDGLPQEIGVELTDAALTSLPDHNHPMLLPLHQKAKAVTPFDHIGFNYMSHGHFPPGVFDVPHFDVHFYMQSVEERLAIPAPSPASMPMFMLLPPAGYMPATYSPTAPEAEMGLHWGPPPPTFMPFTRVMIYGSYNGALTFIEPMVTVSYLQGAGSSNPYLQPAKFAEAGNYPTVFNVYTDAKSGSHHVTLSNFIARSAN